MNWLKISGGLNVGWRRFLVLALLTLCVFGWQEIGSAMERGTFAEFLARLDDASFANEKLTIVQTAVSENTFTCQQVVSILESFDFDTDRLAALKVLVKRIEDPANRETIIDVFTYASDRQEAQELLDGIKPATPTRPGTDLPGNSGNYGNAQSFQELLTQLRKASFADEKFAVLERMLPRFPGGFYSVQVVQILQTFDFDVDRLAAIHMLQGRVLEMKAVDLLEVLKLFMSASERLEVLGLLADTVSDMENKFFILDAFTYQRDKEQARQILDTLPANNRVFGRVRARRVIFIIDVSGSMSNSLPTMPGQTKLSLVQSELANLLKSQFGPEKKFDLIVFGAKTEAWGNRLNPATAENIADALRFLQGYKGDGSTEPRTALERALRNSDVEAVYFVSDGLIAPEQRGQMAQLIQDVEQWNRARRIPIHTVAVLPGAEPEEYKVYSRQFMQELARVTGGTYRALE